MEERGAGRSRSGRSSTPTRSSRPAPRSRPTRPDAAKAARGGQTPQAKTGPAAAAQARAAQPPVTRTAVSGRAAASAALLSRWRAGELPARTLRRMALGLALVIAAALLIPPVHNTLAQRDQIAALTVKVAEQEQQVADLQKQLDRWKDPAYVEQQARGRLKFVRPGETAYSVIDANPGVPAQDGPEVATTSTTGTDGLPWFTELWSSLHASDTGATAPGTGR